MKIYLDDDCSQRLLVLQLQRAGNQVLAPVDFNLSGERDAIHFRKAIQETAVLLTRNYGDFKSLHELLMTGQGHHPGVLLLREDNDPKKDMKPDEIVRAIRNFLASGLPLADHCIVLNHWR